MRLSGNGRSGNTRGSDAGSVRPCTGWGASPAAIPTYLSCGSRACGRRLECRSRMRRESHVRFWEGGGVQVPSATRLVQEAIVRAWANIDHFQPGTSMNAWLFTILRNSFYSQFRKARRQIADPDGSYAARLRTPPEQNGRCDVQDMLRALEKVPVHQREALLLIVAEGLSYEEAAQVCGVAVGTIKSRVNRARERLAKLLALEEAEDLGLDRVTQAALQSAF